MSVTLHTNLGDIKCEISCDEVPKAAEVVETIGAHPPVAVDPAATMDNERQDLIFRCSIALQRPVIDPFMAVGFLPLPDSILRVGQLVTIRWRIERLKVLGETDMSQNKNDDILYEVSANSVNWMIAGRNRGYVSISNKQGSWMIISILCLPLVAGYGRPLQIRLPNVNETNVRCNLAGPHQVYVLPPVLSSSCCLPA